MATDLFAQAAETVRRQGAPLAERMRPRTLDEFCGQAAIIGPGKILRRIFEEESKRSAAGSTSLAPLPSIILWGPPGTGKTTLAFLLARAADAHFETFSAVSSGIKEVREAIKAARERLSFERRRTVLFVDEIHRFNKAQQDGFLPAIEEGTLSLLGATTENPSFELNSALLSRARVFVLQHLDVSDLATLLDRAMTDTQRGLGGHGLVLPPEARDALAQLAGGDARTALNALELAALAVPSPVNGDRNVAAPTGGDRKVAAPTVGDRNVAAPTVGDRNVVAPTDGDRKVAAPTVGDRNVAAPTVGDRNVAAPTVGDRNVAAPARTIDVELVREALQRHTILYDQSGEEHYNLISAMHKSIRHSDPDATLYYLARMIAGGEDPMFIARRLVRAASEDIGLADPQAVVQALAAKQAVEFIGYPECDTALAQAAVYLAIAPKSNAIYVAMGAAKAEVKESGPLPVPLHLRNAPTSLMKQLGYGKEYQYDHNWPDKISPQDAMPEALRGKQLYTPGTLGFEKEIAKRLEYFKRVREALRKQGGENTSTT